MVNSIREIEVNPQKKKDYLEKEIVKRGLGKKGKVMLEGEAVFRDYFRKSLMAGMDIPKGTVIKPEMLYAMRPQVYAGGLPSEQYEEVLGRKIKTDLKKYDPIKKEIFIE